MEGCSIPKKQGKLLNLGAHEQRDELEEKLENGFALVLSRMGNLHEREAHDQLLQVVADQKMYEVVIGGLLYGVLSDPLNASKVEILTVVYVFFCFPIFFSVLLFRRLFYLRGAREGVAGYSILKYIERRGLIRCSTVILFDVCRFIYELTMNSQNESLCSHMIKLCEWLLKERFMDCAQLGRDLVLLLIHLSKLPQFAAVWKQLLHAPAKLASSFGGVEELMSRPCPLNFPIYHVSVTIQRKMEFIFKLRPGAHEKHIEWIRLKSGVEQQWCKLNLFWDWFCYDPQMGAHNLLEPGYNVIRHLLHAQPLLANSLLDFIIRMSAELYPPFRARITTSVTNVLKAISDYSIGSPSTIIEHHMVQKSVRDAFREMFKLPVRAAPPIVATAPTPAPSTPPSELETTPPAADAPLPSGDQSNKPSSKVQPETASVSESVEDTEGCDEKITALLAAIKEEFRDGIESLSAASSADNETRCELTNRLMSSLFDCMSAELYPPFRARITTSVTNVLKAISDYSIGSPSTIIEHHMVQKSVRDAFREMFKLPVRAAPPIVATAPTPAPSTPPSELETTPPAADAPLPSGDQSNKPSSKVQPETASVSESVEDTEGCDEKITALLAAIKEEFRDGIESLSAASSADNETRCELTNRLMSSLFDCYELLDGEQIELIAECLLTIFRKQLFSRKPLPDDFTPSLEALDQIFSDPLYVIFRSFCLLPDDDAMRQPMLSLICEMRERCSSVSYLLLFFIFSGRGNQGEIDTSAYKDLCRELGKPLMQQLVTDLDMCHLDDYVLFGHLVPFIYDKFAMEAMGCVELMKLLAYSLDCSQVLSLMSGNIRENITLFRKDSFPAMLTASLTWETTAQLIFWQLAHGENVPIDWAVQVIPKLQYSKHAEAVGNIYIMLSRLDREPNISLLRALLSRPPSPPDMFTVDCLKILIGDSDSVPRIAELLGNLIEKAIHSGDLTPQSSVGKQKRPNQRNVCLEQLFAHLDQFRQSCLSKASHLAEQFLARRELQLAFDNARKSDKVSTLRIRFSELFAVMEILSDDGAQNPRTSRRKAVKKSADLSDDEGKTKKKRQKCIVLDSDSD
ncbi:Integrator complex subunit 3 [Toxocara canis]|uniref:SOSS complex subunit A homolog n=1 Tax=Toxocara canis TaxID=6265 RepID=A0A0B2VLQ6_TOXCA|nr:Integrator complex subunit 3 [Toxocara canis]